MGENLSELVLDKVSMDLKLKVPFIKGKIDNWTSSKFKNSAPLGMTLLRCWKGKVQYRLEHILKLIFGMEVVYRMHKELSKFSSEKTVQLENRKMMWTIISQRGHTESK